MSRIINTDGAGKERMRLSREAVVALRELMRQNQVDDYTRDLTAYLVLILNEISLTIDPTVSAWEKKGYWIKADRFRLEWEWCLQSSEKLRTALLKENWEEIAKEAARIATKLNSIKVPIRNRIGTPWRGSWEKLVNYEKALNG